MFGVSFYLANLAILIRFPCDKKKDLSALLQCGEGGKTRQGFEEGKEREIFISDAVRHQYRDSLYSPTLLKSGLALSRKISTCSLEKTFPVP